MSGLVPELGSELGLEAVLGLRPFCGDGVGVANWRRPLCEKSISDDKRAMKDETSGRSYKTRKKK